MVVLMMKSCVTDGKEERMRMERVSGQLPFMRSLSLPPEAPKLPALTSTSMSKQSKATALPPVDAPPAALSRDLFGT